jgi:hypothetical protein
MQQTTAETRPARTRPPRAARRFGYVVAIGCNAVAIYIAHHLLDWGWPRFLTDQFDDVLPLITASFIYGMATNAMFVLYDQQWFKSLVNVGGSIIAFVITLRLYQVYPFDFSGYAVNWSWAISTLLIIGMVVTAIAAVAESVRVVTSLTRSES